MRALRAELQRSCVESGGGTGAFSWGVEVCCCADSCLQAVFSLLLHVIRCSQILFFGDEQSADVKQGLPFLGTLLLLLLMPSGYKADFVLVLLGFAGVLREKDYRTKWELGRSTRKLLFEHPQLK